MEKRLFVAGIPFSFNDVNLKDLFAKFGTVESATIITDRDTGRSKGFGFVEMSTAEEAQAAIKELNNSTVEDRKIVVNLARPREERPRNDFQNRSGGRRDFGGRPRGKRW